MPKEYVKAERVNRFKAPGGLKVNLLAIKMEFGSQLYMNRVLVDFRPTKLSSLIVGR